MLTIATIDIASTGHHDHKMHARRCSYADRHRFHESILKKDKLKSTEPLHVINHLRRFRRWMFHAPPFLELSIIINIFFDTLIGPPRSLCEKYLVSSHEIWKCSSLSQFLDYIKRELVSDMVCQSLSLKYREYVLGANDQNLKLF